MPRRPVEASTAAVEAGRLLNDLPTLWAHPGVDDHQREHPVQELLAQAAIAGNEIGAIEPREAYKPRINPPSSTVRETVQYRQTPSKEVSPASQAVSGGGEAVC